VPINNLHSLLNSPWYIDQSYAEAHLPLLFNILEGKTIYDSSKNTSKDNCSVAFNSNGINVLYDDIEENTKEKYAVIVPIKSPIYKYNQECGPRGTRTIMNLLEGLKSDDAVSGVILDMDSGGGQVYGTPEFHDYLVEYPKPLVTYTDGIMASAAYYIGASTDHIIANKRADAIGSIGAYAQFLDLQGYYEQKGAKLHTIYSSKSEEKNKSYRELLKGNYDIYIKEDLDPVVDTFINDIKNVRPGINEVVFKGATYNPSVSLELGLIDEIGTLQDAIDKVFELSKSSINNNNTQETMATQAKEREHIQSVLGLTDPLASTDNGSYLNDDQLDTIEAHLQSQEESVTSAETASQTAETNLTNAQNDISNINTALDNAIQASGIEIEENATPSQKISAIEAHISSIGKQPGETHTTVKNSEEEGEAHAYVDFSASIYKNN